MTVKSAVAQGLFDLLRGGPSSRTGEGILCRTETGGVACYIVVDSNGVRPSPSPPEAPSAPIDPACAPTAWLEYKEHGDLKLRMTGAVAQRLFDALPGGCRIRTGVVRGLNGVLCRRETVKSATRHLCEFFVDHDGVRDLFTPNCPR